MTAKTLTLDPLFPDGTPAAGTRLTVSVDRDVAIVGSGVIARTGAAVSYVVNRDGTFPTIAVTPNDDPSLQDWSKGYALTIEAEATPAGGVTGGPWTVVITSLDPDTLSLSDLDMRNVVGLPPNISLADTMARLSTVEGEAADAVATSNSANSTAADALTTAQAANDWANQHGNIVSAAVVNGDLVFTLDDTPTTTLNAGAIPTAAVTDPAVAAVIGDTQTKAALDAAYASVAIIPRTDVQAVGQGELTLNVKDHGAIGDGASHTLTDAGYATLAAAQAVYPKAAALTDQVDWCAIQTCIDLGPTVLIPAGTYMLHAELAVPSYREVYGSGIDKTTLKVIDGVDTKQCGITNAGNTRTQHTTADTSIVLHDFTIDGNYAGRTGAVVTDADSTSGANIGFACVTNSQVRRVRSIRAQMHCFDISASVYNGAMTPGYNSQWVLQSDGVTPFIVPGPSADVTVSECIAEDSWQDDAFTCHWSDRILFEKCKAIRTIDLHSFSSNGFEIDEGSRYCTARDCYVNGYVKAYQTKGHSTSRPAVGTKFEKCVAENSNVGFEIAFPHRQAQDFPTLTYYLARDVSLIDCEVKNLATVWNATTAAAPGAVGAGTLYPELWSVYVQGYANVTVNNLKVHDVLGGGQFYAAYSDDLTVDGAAFDAVWETNNSAVSYLINLQDYSGKTPPSYQMNTVVRNVLVTNSNLAGSVLNTHAGLKNLTVDTLRAARRSGTTTNVVCQVSGWEPTNTFRAIANTGYAGDVYVNAGQNDAGMWSGGLVQRSGVWQSLTLPASWTGTIQYIRDGRLVTVNFKNVGAPSTVTSGTTTLATLGNGYKPDAQVATNCLPDATIGNYKPSWISNNGQIRAAFVTGETHSGTVSYLV